MNAQQQIRGARSAVQDPAQDTVQDVVQDTAHDVKPDTAQDAVPDPAHTRDTRGPQGAQAVGTARGAQDTQGTRGARKTPGTRGRRGARTPAARPGSARGALGRYGEDLAVRSLTAAGLAVLARNWRAGRTGEIDIVARDGDALVICEVKTRRAGAFEHPMAAVTPGKAQRLRGLAERWLQEHGGAPPGGVRIDLVGVLVPDRGAPRVEHVRGVA